jgi:hypothetical protein
MAILSMGVLSGCFDRDKGGCKSYVFAASKGYMTDVPGDSSKMRVTLDFTSTDVVFVDKLGRDMTEKKMPLKDFVAAWNRGENAFKKNPPVAIMMCNFSGAGFDSFFVKMTDPIYDATTDGISFITEEIPADYQRDISHKEKNAEGKILLKDVSVFISAA